MKTFKLKTIWISFIAMIFFTITSVPTSVFASSFYRTGTIVRTLSDTVNHGGCMIHISTNIANGCPNSGWVSLDCKGNFFPAADGRRAYASALVAFSLGKQVTIRIDNLKKIDGYCTVTRIDMIQ